MRDPDTGLHMEYLPLYTSVPIGRLEEAWEWARTYPHPECGYGVWSISRIYETTPPVPYLVDTPSIMWIMVHLSMMLSVYGEYKSGSLRSPAEPELARFHCELTGAGEAWGHPEARMLVYRILAARAARAAAKSASDVKSAILAIWNTTERLEALLEESPEFTAYPVPRLRSLFTAEEVVCRDALCWARRQPESSEAFALFERLRKRTDSLEADNKLGRPMGTRSKQKHYVARIQWHRKIAALYLESRAGRAM